ncbi:DUF6216 family protein [Pseudomonas sp. PLB05]|uniref:DUF6216 family protein n=1 Tax=Pseudomonas sp. PLB05 TaxID=2899078 RepID=UPI001E47E776|nr:DUF6216 family protein [Pseudomonas sp. PLB05]MCD4862968.1 DUF6216 family protein [Pseudomonas sp. PLB05]
MSNTDVISEISRIIDLFQKAYPLLVALAVIALHIWSWQRSGSAFFIFNKLIFLIGGGAKMSNNLYNDAWESVKYFHLFRMKTGIKFKNNQQIENALLKIKEKSIGLEELMKIKKYYIPENCEIKDPDLKKIKKGNILLGFATAVFAVISLTFLLPDYALLSVRKTGTLFWATKEKAYHWNLSWSIHENECSAGTTKLAEVDQKVICELISDKENKFLEKTVFEQRCFGSILAFVCALWILSMILEWSKASLAFDLRQKLNRETPEQLDLFNI